MPVRALPLALAALLAAPFVAAEEPSEALCIIFIRPIDANFQLIEVAADLILTPDERANLSERVDADRDGAITEEEVSRFTNGTSRTIDGWEVPRDERVFLDGSDAFQVLIYTRLRNWTGPVEEARKGVVTEARYHRYGPGPTYAHELRGAFYAKPTPTPEVVVEVVVIDAPPGWVVAKVSQIDASGAETNASYPEERSVRLSGFDLSRGAIRFRDATAPSTTTPTTPSSTGPIPAPGLFAALVVTSLAALALARPTRR